MEACTSDRGSARPDWAVPPALELGRAVAPRRYRPHYRPPLVSVGGSALSTHDWSFEFKFDCLNTNSTV
jgi:hypothetical protein